MRLLLDTHAFLWWDDGSLPARVKRRIRAADAVLVSAVSAWEVSIKAALGRIVVEGSLLDAVREYGFEPLPVHFAHAELVRSLPPHHRDPFDRLLVAQAVSEGLTLVTRDAAMRAYAVPTLWE